MEGLIRCCYELMNIELRAGNREHFDELRDLARMIDIQRRYAIIEARGWVTKDGKHFYIESKVAKAIKSAFRKGLANKSSKETVDTIIDNHEALAEFTPKGMKLFLEECGYEVKPLGSRSSLKGRSLGEGGGYRVTFGGDGYFQYHPEKGSHHDSKEYWKVSNGEWGKKRYGMDGKEF